MANLQADLRFLKSVKPDTFYFVATKEDSEANPECLLMVREVLYPQDWRSCWKTASDEQKSEMIKNVKVQGTWFYRYNETADSVHLVDPRKLERNNKEDVMDERAFSGPPPHVHVDQRRVYVCKNRFGDYKATVPILSLRRQVSVRFGKPTPGSSGLELWYDKSYDDSFMAYEDTSAIAAGNGPSSAAAAAAAGAGRSRPRNQSISRGSKHPRHHHDQDQDHTCPNPTKPPAIPQHLKGPSPLLSPDDGETGRTVPIAPYFSAMGRIPDSHELREALLQELRGHRAPHPSTRQLGKHTDKATCLWRLDVCCGSGGSAYPLEDGMLRTLLGCADRQQQEEVVQTRTLWSCDIKMSALLSHMANNNDCTIVLCCHAEELQVLVYMMHELWIWLLYSMNNLASTPQVERAGGGEMQVQEQQQFHDEDGTVQQQQQQSKEPSDAIPHIPKKQPNQHILALQHLQGKEQGGPIANHSDDTDETDHGDVDDDGDSEVWAVRDIWGVRLHHYVKIGKNGQLEKELLVEDCQLEFLVEWSYKETRHKERWPDYPEGLLQWVPLRDALSSLKLLQNLVRRILVTEALLPKKGMRLLLTAGCPCQELSGHNQSIHARGDIFDSVRNKIVFSVLKMAFQLEVSHIILEQVTDVSRWEDGIWHRTVQAMLNQAGYQQKTCVVHAASHGLPQIRPRIFLVACTPGHQLPPAPRPEFHRTLMLPLAPDENGNQVVRGRKLRRHKRALRRCYPTAGEDAFLYPSQTLEDATSNLENRENFSLSPVTLVEDLHLPLQHVLAQPPPAATPSAELRFALYLGNAAPAVLAFSRAVLYRFAKDHHAAMERASQRVNSLAGQGK
ncbi:hypothetical protein VaNZ11_014674, partial [Volvox africanus]